MTLGLLDLSIVTDELLTQLDHYTTTTPDLWTEGGTTQFDIDYTGLAPDTVRATQTGCRVSLYLFHVTADRFHRNTYPLPRDPQTPSQRIPAQRIPYQPLSLTLYYLLTAYSSGSYVHEQQAMSIALKYLHEHPIVTAHVKKRPIELTLTLEPQTIDEIGRLWQSIATSIRLSAVYRVGVVILEPPPPPAPARVEHPPQIQGVPGPIRATVTADASGVATVVIADAGFVAGAPQVYLGDVRIVETNAVSPAAGEFHVVDPTTILIQAPAGTARGHWIVNLRSAAGHPTMPIVLVVP